MQKKASRGREWIEEREIWKSDREVIGRRSKTEQPNERERRRGKGVRRRKGKGIVGVGFVVGGRIQTVLKWDSEGSNDWGVGERIRRREKRGVRR